MSTSPWKLPAPGTRTPHPGHSEARRSVDYTHQRIRTLHSPRSARTLYALHRVLNTLSVLRELSEILACLCTQHLPFWVRTRRRVVRPSFFRTCLFFTCFKLPHATYLTTHDVAYGVFSVGGLVVRWKEQLSLSHPFWIWSRVSLNIEPLRENQSDKPRLSVAQPRAPAGRRAHATNTRLSNIGFCGSPSCHVDFGPSAAIEKSSKILLISYDKNWAPPLHRIFYQEHGFRCRGVF